MQCMKNKKILEKTKKSQNARSHLWTPFWSAEPDTFVLMDRCLHLFWCLCSNLLQPQRCSTSSLECVASKLYLYHFFFTRIHSQLHHCLFWHWLTLENDDETTTQGDDDLTLKGLTMTLSADIWTKTQVSHKQLLINIHDFYCSFCLCSWLRD